MRKMNQSAIFCLCMEVALFAFPLAVSALDTNNSAVKQGAEVDSVPLDEESRSEDDARIAIERMRKKAESGEAAAQHDMGRRNYYGDGVQQDFTKAVAWFRKAAEQGFAESQSYLGACYAQGLGIEPNADKAVEWFQKAAMQGVAKAQYLLGVSLANGVGIEKDDTKAFEWFFKAAEQGFAEAQHSLGDCYSMGKGVEKDDSKALLWYRKAAEQGNAEAMFCIGSCYAKGEGVEKDEAKALEWCREAAEHGHAIAKWNLATSYENGHGIEKDVQKATEWYRAFAEQNRPEAEQQYSVFMKALATADVGTLFRGLPPSYQTSVRESAMALAKTIDSDLWQLGQNVLLQISRAIMQQNRFIASYMDHSEIAQESGWTAEDCRSAVVSFGGRIEAIAEQSTKDRIANGWLPLDLQPLTGESNSCRSPVIVIPRFVASVGNYGTIIVSKASDPRFSERLFFIEGHWVPETIVNLFAGHDSWTSSISRSPLLGDPRINETRNRLRAMLFFVEKAQQETTLEAFQKDVINLLFEYFSLIGVIPKSLPASEN